MPRGRIRRRMANIRASRVAGTRTAGFRERIVLRTTRATDSGVAGDKRIRRPMKGLMLT